MKVMTERFVFDNPFRALVDPKTVPESELVLDFVRSSGPGGQNVNKTSTKAQLRWDIQASRIFTEDEKRLLVNRLRHRINNRGEVWLASDEERSQLQNKQRVIRQLQDLIGQALTPEIPRVATRPTKGSRERRLADKSLQSRKKAARDKVRDHD